MEEKPLEQPKNNKNAKKVVRFHHDVPDSSRSTSKEYRQKHKARKMEEKKQKKEEERHEMKEKRRQYLESLKYEAKKMQEYLAREAKEAKEHLEAEMKKLSLTSSSSTASSEEKSTTTADGVLEQHLSSGMESTFSNKSMDVCNTESFSSLQGNKSRSENDVGATGVIGRRNFSRSGFCFNSKRNYLTRVRQQKSSQTA